MPMLVEKVRQRVRSRVCSLYKPSRVYSKLSTLNVSLFRITIKTSHTTTLLTLFCFKATGILRLSEGRAMKEDQITCHNASIDRRHRDQLEELETHECGANLFRNVVQWHLAGIMFVALYTSVSLSLSFVAEVGRCDVDAFPFLVSSALVP